MSPCLVVDKLTLGEPPQSTVWPQSSVEQTHAPLRSGQEITVSGMPGCVFHSRRRSGFHCQTAFLHLRGKMELSSFSQSLCWAPSHEQVKMCLAKGVKTVLVYAVVIPSCPCARVTYLDDVSEESRSI